MPHQTNDFYCDLLLGRKVEADKLRESERILAFLHPDPSWTFHCVIVPKPHIVGLTDVADMSIVREAFEVARSIIVDRGLSESNYRIMTNGGEFQQFPHLDFQLVSGSTLPELWFCVFPPTRHYMWVRDNPRFRPFAHAGLEALNSAIRAATDELKGAIAGKEKQIMRRIAELTGYPWHERGIRIYPTFLSPSWSHPLTIGVLEIRDGKPVAVSTSKLVGVLIHELAHNSAPPRLFQNRETSEQVMDLISFKVMEDLGFDTGDYRAFSDRITAEQGRYEPRSLNAEQVFVPTVKDFLSESRYSH